MRPPPRIHLRETHQRRESQDAGAARIAAVAGVEQQLRRDRNLDSAWRGLGVVGIVALDINGLVRVRQYVNHLTDVFIRHRYAVHLNHAISDVRLIGFGGIDLRPQGDDLARNPRPDANDLSPDLPSTFHETVLRFDVDDLLQSAVTFDDKLDRFMRPRKKDRRGDLVKLQHGLPVNPLNLVARQQPGLFRRTIRLNIGDARPDRLHPYHEDDHEQQAGEQYVGHNSGRHDRHPPAHRFVDERPGIFLETKLLGLVVEILLPEHLHVTAQWQDVEAVAGFPSGESQHFAPKTDRELLDAHVGPLSHQKVAHLMDENYQGEAQEHHQVRPDRVPHRQRAPLSHQRRSNLC